MPITQAERRERARKAVLEAATEEFAERGFAGARFDSIARRAGTNRATIFYYFKDKQALYCAMLDDRVVPFVEELGKLIDLATAAIHSPDTVHEVFTGASMQVDFVRREPLIAKLVLREIIDFNPEEPSSFAQILQSLAEKVTRLLNAWQALGNGLQIDPQMILMATFGASLLRDVARPMLEPASVEQQLGPDAQSEEKAQLVSLIASLLGISAEALLGEEQQQAGDRPS